MTVCELLQKYQKQVIEARLCFDSVGENGRGRKILKLSKTANSQWFCGSVRRNKEDRK